MDLIGIEGQLNINFKKIKKSFSSISPFKKIGENDRQTLHIGFNSGDITER